MPHLSPFPVPRRRRMSSPPPPSLSPIPEDIQVEILSRVGDALSVVRCAATCKTWRRLIKEPGFLSHLQRRCRAGGFDPSTLLGFFFRDTSQSLPRRRRYLRRPTRFFILGNSTPMAVPLSRFLTTMGDLDTLAPVGASAGGLVALCRFECAWQRAAWICVCNLVAGTSTLLPPLPYFFPEKIIFLEADSASFRLLAVRDDRQGTLNLCVFSQSGGDGCGGTDWDTSHTVELPDNMVVDIASPAVVHRNAVHWICGTRGLPHAVHAVAVRITEAGTSVSRFDLPPRAGVHHLTTAMRVMRLFSSAQCTVSLVLVDELVLSIWNLEDNSTERQRQRWSCCKAVHLMPMLSPIIFSGSKVEVELSIQGLCEKSGFLFVDVVGDGLFMLNLGTMKLVKISKGHFTKYLCPYAIDFASCIEAMKSF